VNDRHAAVGAIGSALGVFVLLVVAGGVAGPVLLAGLGVAVLAAGLVLGLSALVVVCSIAQVGAVAWLVGSTGAMTEVVVAAPLVWLAAEAGWRSLDLRPAVRARMTATTSWLGIAVAVAIGAAGVAVLVDGLERVGPQGGLTFRALGVVSVVAAAGVVTLVARRPLSGR
jgi:hypothetical protein